MNHKTETILFKMGVGVEKTQGTFLKNAELFISKHTYKKRHICFKCKAKKYAKYMCRYTGIAPFPVLPWQCKNEEKCVARGANYKK